MSAGVKAFKSLQKLPKKAKKLPKLVLMLPMIVWGILVKIASVIVILPLDTFSGKTLTSTLFMLIVTLTSGLVYLVQGGATARLVVTYAGTTTALLAVTFLIAYPLDRAGHIERMIVKTGMRQRNRLSTGFAAVAFGLVLGTILTVLVDYLVAIRDAVAYTRPEIDPVFVGSFVVLVLLFSVLFYVVFQEKSSSLTRDILSIIEIIDDEGGSRELVVQNLGDDVVWVTSGKIQDSQGNRYSLDRDLKFRPGEKESLTLPEGFSLRTIDKEAPPGVGRFYEKKITAIIAKTGDTYVLEWED